MSNQGQSSSSSTARQLRSGTQIPDTQAEASVTHTPHRARQRSAEDLSDSNSVLRDQLETMRQRNDLLDDLVVEYRRQYGRDYSHYPEDVANHAKASETLTPATSRPDVEVSQDAIPAPLVQPQRAARPKHMDPEPYSGGTLRKLTDYLQACGRIFDYSTQEFGTPNAQIRWAATFLKGPPAKAWSRSRRLEPDRLATMTWEDYKTFLQDHQVQPTARRVGQTVDYHDAKQRPDQPILAFVDYLEELEEDQEPMSQAQERDMLFAKIRPEIRQRLLENGQATQCTTREELITAISLLEAARPKRAGEGRANTSTHKPANMPARQQPRRPWKSTRPVSTNQPRAGSKPAILPPPRPVTNPNQCFNCKQLGHWAKDCPKNKEDDRAKRPRVARASTATPPGTSTQRMEVTLRLLVSPLIPKALVALIDSGSEDNFISRLAVKENRLSPDTSGPRAFRTLSGSSSIIYGTVSIAVQLEDSIGVQQDETIAFRVVDMPGIDIILGWPWLEGVNPAIDWRTRTWRYRYDNAPISILPASGFQGLLRERPGYAIYPRLCLADVEPAIPQEYAEYSDVFSEEQSETLPPLDSNKQHSIELKEGREPPYSPIYNLSETELKVLRDYLHAGEEKGWIRRSTSSAGAPILFVPKKDGSLRLCVDYRGLNQVTIRNSYPLPLISELLDRLRGASIFTKLDLRNAYHQIRIRPGDEWKTAFRTRYGHWEYLVMPFGLSNAPATFQAYVDKALTGLVDIICVVYLDDILIFSKDEREHIDHVCQVLNRLRQHRLYAKLSKCHFSVRQAEFLGYIISASGVSMESSRIAAISEWPIPQTFQQVQVFLGFANFYRRFIAGFSAIAKPLTGLLKGSKKGKKSGRLEWGPEEQLAFDQLKAAFVSAPVLRHFDPSRPIRVETDASGFAIAGILSQPGEWPAKDGAKTVWHPVAFYSRKLESAELNYGVHDQELLAIVQCFKHWRHYLEGSRLPFEVLTDHNNLRYFMTTSDLSRRQARWAQVLSAYDFEIVYRPGKSNPADGPSRRPDYEPARGEPNIMLPTLRNKLREAAQRGVLRPQDDASVKDSLQWLSFLWSDEALAQSPSDADQSVSRKEPAAKQNAQGKPKQPYFVPRALVSDVIRRDNEEGAGLAQLIAKVQSTDALAGEAQEKIRTNVDSKWTVDSQGLLRLGGKAYVPPDGALRGEVMKNCHDHPTAGHYGQRKTVLLVQRHYWWPTLRQDVNEYVKTCDICQRTKASRQQMPGEMQALPIPTKPFESITMDFITDLPPSTDSTTGAVHDCIMVVVDRYTKVARYIPCRKTLDAPELARLFVSYWFKDQGLPQSIVSDRGSVFTSKFWSELCFRLQVKRRLSTAFHPQTDGQTERQNQSIETWFRCYICYQQDDWVDLLPVAEFAYNNAPHDSIGMSPNQARYGLSLDVSQGIADDPLRGEIPAARQRAEQLVETRKALEKSWRETKEAQARGYNQKHRPVEFQVGQTVLVSSKNIKTIRANKKLDHRYLGPFEIIDRVGQQAYHLRLPAKYSRLHPVFHISLLKEYTRRAGEEPERIQPDLVDNEEEWEVEEILDFRRKAKTDQFLVRWKGFSPADDSWEPRQNLTGCEELIQEFHNKQKTVIHRPMGKGVRRSKAGQ
jgi:hypothetical protein